MHNIYQKKFFNQYKISLYISLFFRMARPLQLMSIIVVYVSGIIIAAAGFAALPLVFWGAYTYTQALSPFPSVADMMVFLIAKTIAWLTLILILSDLQPGTSTGLHLVRIPKIPTSN